LAPSAHLSVAVWFAGVETQRHRLASAAAVTNFTFIFPPVLPKSDALKERPGSARAKALRGATQLRPLAARFQLRDGQGSAAPLALRAPIQRTLVGNHAGAL